MNKYRLKLKQAKYAKETKKQAQWKATVRKHYTELGGAFDSNLGVYKADLIEKMMVEGGISFSSAERWIKYCNPFTEKLYGRSVISLPSQMSEMSLNYEEVSTASKIASLASMLQDAVTMGEAIEEMEEMMYDDDIVMAHESQVNALLGIICDTMEGNTSRMESLSERIKEVKNC